MFLFFTFEFLFMFHGIPFLALKLHPVSTYFQDGQLHWLSQAITCQCCRFPAKKEVLSFFLRVSVSIDFKTFLPTDEIRITRSTTFTIIVGPEKHEHHVHSTLLAQQSPVLHALVTGGMQESIEKRVLWEHVQEHTFSHFCQFVYTGEFTIERPVTDNTNDTENTSISTWLLQHAELMVFAELYAMDGLLALTASKLENALLSLPTPSPANATTQAIAELSKFSFSTPRPEILRKVIISYLEKHGVLLWTDDYFQSIINEVQGLANIFIDCLIASRPKVPENWTIKFIPDAYQEHYVSSINCAHRQKPNAECASCGVRGKLDVSDVPVDIDWVVSSAHE
ncbi:hypothetical protein CC79DRAFT_1063773 [Sarocladium strictum]